MLRLDPSPNDYEEDAVEMFGFQWVTETALVESCGLLFGLLRYAVSVFYDYSNSVIIAIYSNNETNFKFLIVKS